MKDLSTLINEIKTLPKGNIYVKTIKGNLYYYHQYSDNGVKYTKKINESDVATLNEQIEKRKLLEKEVKKLTHLNHVLVLSKSVKELTGYVMDKDIVVAEFEKGELKNINEKLCPLIIKRTKKIEPFLDTRVIDRDRINSRILKKILNIKEKEDKYVSLCAYAVSISDDYWFKPKHSKLKFKDVSLMGDMMFDASLKGLTTFYPNRNVITPELTTVGSYEKGWRIINNEWWLYKSGTKEEIFSELFYASLFELLNLPTAHYEYEEGYIKSKNFATKYNFEPMAALAGDNEDYSYIYSLLKDIKLDIAKDYLRLCFFDVVLNNIDRHNQNLGVLRDKNSGKIVSLAPNFDDNLSLISRDKSLILSTDEGFLKQFIKLIKNNEEIKNCLKEIDIPELDEKILKECLKNIPISSGVDDEQLIQYILLRYKAILAAINK